MSKRSITQYFSSSSSTKENENKRKKTDDIQNESENKKENDCEMLVDDEQKGTASVSRKRVNPSTFFKWKKQFLWLEMVEENDLMICKICKEFAKQEDTNFVSGCPAFRLETVKKHDASLVHSNACKAKAAKENPTQTPLASAIKSMDADVMRQMEKLFNTAYLIAKEDYAFKDFRSLCELQRKNGLKMGETYINDKAGKLFIKYIADSMRQELKDELSKSKYYTLMADGSTDRSTISSEIIYIYYLFGGEPRCRYVALTESKDETASGIKSGIISAIKEFIPDWDKKLIAVSFDGASVNMGCAAGVAKLLENECGQLISVHCVAHRLELAVSDAKKGIKYVHLVEDIIKGIYTYYHTSPKRTKELKDIGEMLDEKILSHVPLHGIRWLQSSHRAVRVIINNLPAVAIHMEQAASSEPDKKISSKLKGYLKSLKSERFIRFLCLMEDILNILARVSEFFQRKFVSIIEICNILETTKLKIQKMISENGATLRQFEADLNIQGDDYVEYKGFQVTRNVNELSVFEEDRRIFLQQIIEALDTRYKSIQSDGVLNNLQILDPANVVNQNENHQIDKKFKDLIEMLPRNIIIDKEAVLEEFQDYKVWCSNKLHLPCQTAWQRLIAESSEYTFCNLSKIIHLMLILPLSTAECERGFSHLNLIKRPSRTSLLTTTVDDLMFVRLYGPSIIEFNPQPAINLWWQDVAFGRLRRPDFKN